MSILGDSAPHDLCPISMFSARDLLCPVCSEAGSKRSGSGVWDEGDRSSDLLLTFVGFF